MPDAPIVSRPYHAKMCCERCTFNSGLHADWCPKRGRFVEGSANNFTIIDWNQWLDVPMRVDPAMDPSTVRIEDDHGNALGSIVNIGKPKE